MELAREVIKYIRDKAKGAYTVDKRCEICGSSYLLELHHYYTITYLVHNYMKKLGLKPIDVLLWREAFISAHEKELYEEVATLCHFHHIDRLHTIYGQSPPLETAQRQKNWVKIQREKNGKLAI